MMIESMFARFVKGSLDFGDKAKYIPYHELGMEYSEEHYKARLKEVKRILGASDKVVKEYTYDIISHDGYEFLDDMDFVLMVRLVNLSMKGTKIIRFVAGNKKIILYYPSWMVEEAINTYV